MRIAVIGAGFAGLGTARMLMRCGFEVTVFERAPDVGGVWSRTRRYPGLRTQNDKRTYAFSEHPMPAHYPQWPSGEQVQRYLESYVEVFRLGPALRLSTEVVSATVVRPGSWSLTVRPAGAGTGTRTGTRARTGAELEETLTFDHLVVANGTFSQPAIPVFPGRTVFEDAGGEVSAVSDFTDLEDARGRDVLVVGYGKSACDAAVEVSDVAASTTVVARELLWKMPRYLGGVLNYKYLLLTRLGEGLFRYIRPTRVERLMHSGGGRVGQAMLNSVGALTVRQLRLRELGLVPRGDFGRIARSTVSLVTEGLYERIRDGRIRVVRDTTIDELGAENGQPTARLGNGETVPADLVICGTGFDQVVPFFAPDLVARLQDDRGNFTLYRQILPPGVPNLTFAGYSSSFFSPLGSEMSAVWIAAHLLGGLPLPDELTMREHVAAQLRWAERRTEGKHGRGTNVVPFSMHFVDEILDDLGLNVSGPTRLRQWLMPVDPASYQDVGARLVLRHRDQIDDLTLGHPGPARVLSRAGRLRRRVRVRN